METLYSYCKMWADFLCLLIHLQSGMGVNGMNNRVFGNVGTGGHSLLFTCHLKVIRCS